MAYLNSGHHRDWENNGYLKIPGFFYSEEVDALQTWVSEISSWEPTLDKWIHHYEINVRRSTTLSFGKFLYPITPI